MQRHEPAGIRRHRSRLFPLIAVITVAYAASGLLGWLTGSGRSASAAGDAQADRPPPQPAEKPRPRVVTLRALDIVLAVDELKRLSVPEVARFAAKKWTDMLAFGQRLEQDFQVRPDLDVYFRGWLAVTDSSSAYSIDQFAGSLSLELCRRPERERELLREMAPAIAAVATGPCPIE